MYRFDGSTVLVIKTDLTYTVTLQTFCTLLSGNRRDAAVSQPLLRQPPAEAERVAYRSSSRSGPWSPRGRLRLLGRSPDARCVRRNWGLDTFRGRVPQWTAGAAHRHRSVLKRRSWRHRGGGRARRAHDKTCVRDGGKLGRRRWAENASRYGRAGPRRKTGARVPGRKRARIFGRRVYR